MRTTPTRTLERGYPSKGEASKRSPTELVKAPVSSAMKRIAILKKKISMVFESQKTRRCVRVPLEAMFSFQALMKTQMRAFSEVFYSLYLVLRLLHDENIVDGHNEDLVNALCLELVVALDVSRYLSTAGTYIVNQRHEKEIDLI